jgi:hypothetical protein
VRCGAVRCGAVLVAMALYCVDLAGQTRVFATHDFANRGSLGAAEDQWADVKTPGNGWVYSVGTTYAPTTDSTVASFSGQAVAGPPDIFESPLRSSSSQVVILQAKNLLNPSLSWQRYFYGATYYQTNNGLSNYARAVAVYASGTTMADWRIVICGDTYDGLLPLSGQFSTAPGTGTTEFLLGPMGTPQGFIATYNGAGDLLWSRHLVSPDQLLSVGGEVCATDVAVHVEGEGAAATDVITWCGYTTSTDLSLPISTVGGTLQVTSPFAPGSVQTSCGTFSFQGGAGIGGGLSADEGLVGRFRASHVNPMPSQVGTDFFCMVPGPLRGRLVALAEITEDRFIVVGNYGMDQNGSTPPLTASAEPCLQQALVTEEYGYAAIFNASQTPTGLLQLEYAELFGVITNPISPFLLTDFRDVAVIGGSAWIVGVTDNPNLPAPQNSLIIGSTRAGFVLQIIGVSSQAGAKRTYYVQPTDGEECELIGVAGFSEFKDHIYCSGNILRPVAGSQPRRHLFVESFFRDTTANLNAVDLNRLRHWEIDAVTSATVRASSPTSAFANNRGPECGGISVDQRGQCWVVGTTRGGTGLPGGPFPGGLPPEPGSGNFSDAFKVVIDMLPSLAKRSDGSGDPTSSWTPLPGFDGGTTPVCARALFGEAIGIIAPLPRMLIDLEGTPGPGNALAVIVDRPPVTNGIVSLGFLRYNLPNVQPNSGALASFGIEYWLDPADWLLSPQLVTGGSLRDPLFGAAGLPPGTWDFHVQFVTLMAQGFAGCPPAFIYAASPALFFEY